MRSEKSEYDLQGSRSSSRRATGTNDAKQKNTQKRRSTSESNRPKKDKNSEKRRIKIWQKVLIGAGALLLVGVGVAWGYLHSIDQKLTLDTDELTALNKELTVHPAGSQEPYYILVLGSDARPGETSSRSDTIMLCRLDPKTKNVSILSIPRDTKVELEGYGTEKINTAMAYDGPAGAVRAVSKFVGVDISHFVLIDFESFTGIVDTLGGVTVKVPLAAEYEGVRLEPGVQTLNGKEALTFVRCRKDYELGDFQRAANQRTFLKALAKQVMEVPVGEMPRLIDSMASYVKTDLTASGLLGLVNEFHGVNMDTSMYTGQVPAVTASVDGVSYVLPIEEDWAAVREKYINGDTPFVDKNKQPAVIE